MQSYKSRKLHHLSRKDQTNAKSERIKILCLCSTCLITILNLTSIVILQVTKTNSVYQNNLKNDFFKDYKILSQGSGIYLSTLVLLLCLAKYTYQSVMFRITKNEDYSKRKFLVLTVASNLTACIQSAYIVIILLRSKQSTNAKKYNSGIFESTNISTKLALTFIFISTFYSILVAILLWRKLLLNDEKIALIHRDRDSIKSNHGPDLSSSQKSSVPRVYQL